MAEARSRPAVAVVLPFHGPPSGAAEAISRFADLALRAGDELVIVDNNAGGPLPQAADPVTVLRSPVPHSAYAARNIGAESTSAPWLLFLDDDCRPPTDLLDRYFHPEPPAAEAGAVAGQVAGEPGQRGVVAAYVRSRGHLDQAILHEHSYRPTAVTANLLVRREAWQRIGGFAERTRSGADADFCWRLQDAGYTLGLNTRALVHHEHRSSLRGLLAQARRDGAGDRWLAGRHPGYARRLGAGVFARALGGAFLLPLAGRPRRGLFKAIDGVWAAAVDLGSMESNAPPEPVRDAPATVVLLHRFPAAGDPCVSAAADTPRLAVEALAQPAIPAWSQGRAAAMAAWDEAGPRDRLRAAARLGLRGCPVPPALAPAVERVRGSVPGARLLAEPGLEGMATRLRTLARRPDLAVEELPPDRDRAAARLYTIE